MFEESEADLLAVVVIGATEFAVRGAWGALNVVVVIVSCGSWTLSHSRSTSSHHRLLTSSSCLSFKAWHLFIISLCFNILFPFLFIFVYLPVSTVYACVCNHLFLFFCFGLGLLPGPVQSRLAVIVPENASLVSQRLKKKGSLKLCYN